MSTGSSVPANGPVGLSPEAYLAGLRESLRREMRGDAIEELKEGIDEWVLGGVDPFEPLTKRGVRTIAWDHGGWSGGVPAPPWGLTVKFLSGS